MIIAITGNVKFPITLDPTVWIFDDRKVKFDEAFELVNTEKKENEFVFSSPERYRREIFGSQNDNPPIPKKEGEDILKNTYIMPFEYFYDKMEISADATEAGIVHSDGSEESITLEQLEKALFLFALEGKAIRKDGPIHIYFRDGSNKDAPIKDIKKIIIQ